MKKLLTLILCFALAFALAVPAFAKCEGERPADHKYVKSLYALSYSNCYYVNSMLGIFGLPSTYKDDLVGGQAGSDNDFNKGGGVSSQYIRLVYSDYTTNTSDAITNLVAVYKNKGVAGDKQITVDGITYTAVPGCSVCKWDSENKYFEFTYDAFDFNDSYENDSVHKAVYLYYTTDSRAGAPITKLNIYYDSQNRNKDNLVKEISTKDVCDFNEGFDFTNAVYLQMERESSNVASAFADSTSVIVISVGVAVILGVVGFVVLRKKKETV